MCGAELLQQLLVGRRLLQRVELDAVDVLQQGVAEHGVVGGVPDDGRHGLQAGRASRPESTLPHDELVGALAVLADDDRLEEAELLDAVGELLERLVVEDLTGLLRVGDDGRHGHLPEFGAGNPDGAHAVVHRGYRRPSRLCVRRLVLGPPRGSGQERHRRGGVVRGRRHRCRGVLRRWSAGGNEGRQASAQAAALVHDRSPLIRDSFTNSPAC